MLKKVGFLGPEGSFSEEAVLKYIGKDHWIKTPYNTLEDVFLSVESGETQIGIVPIENSCEGAVNQTLDLLAYEYNLKIAGEIILPIKHNLLLRSDSDINKLECILSHPQALAQCRKYLSANFSDIPLLEVSSTAEAARQVKYSEKDWAAIGTERAARAYGLNVAARNINDTSKNETRFIVLSRENNNCIGKKCKTSLLVYIHHWPGALFQVLKEFYLKGINLTKIESRPTKTKIGDYLFFIDFEGYYQEPRVREALEGIKAVAQKVRVLGSYPSYPSTEYEVEGNKTMSSPTLDNLRQEIDLIDEQIIELLGKRTKLVDRVANFKETAAKVRDPERERFVIKKLKRVAVEKGFHPDVAVKIYKILFDHFVSQQKRKLAK
ncbi:MAG: prephenate dehydratase [Clostridia bacterium]|jgi:prephenate dehydratase|nr:Prephenate dehydratase [Clostridiales bacterium]MDK2984837.1 prephenate dehydratase [Clostridia bacterium]